MMATETRRIVVELQSKGNRSLDKIAKGFDGIRRSSARTANALEKFDRIFSRLASFTIAGVGITSIVGVADSLQLLRDRIRVFEGDRADETFLRLGEVANFTRTSIDNIAESYNRLALSTKDLGLNSEALLGLTTALQQSFRLSGASIAEANAATIQLSQGLASGQLRGQELRSVLEQNAVIGEILADTFDTARGNLIKFAESGEITSQVVLRALADNAQRLNDEAEKLGQTFGQTVTRAVNDAKIQFAELNKTVGLNSLFQKGVEALVNNLDTLAALLAGAVITKAVFALGTAFTSLSGGITLTNIALGILQSQLLGTLVALAVNPVTAFAVALGTLAAATVLLITNWERLGFLVGGSILIIFKGAVDGLKNIVDGIRDFISSIPGVPEAITRALDNISSRFGRNSATLERGIIRFAEAQNKVEESTNGTADAQRKYIQELLKASQNVQNTGNASSNFAAQLGELNQKYNKGILSLQQYNAAVQGLELGRLNEQFNKGQVNLDQYNQRLDRITGGAIPKLNKQLEQGQIDLIEYNEKLREIDFERVKRGFEQGTVSAIEFNSALIKTQEQFSADGALFQGTNQFIQSAGTLASNIADAVENTFNRLEDSLVDFVNTGKFEFRQFTNAILQDLLRIIIRQNIVRGLASGLGSAFGGSSGGSGIDGGFTGPPAAANGASFIGQNATFFANGGVVDRTTAFGFGNNQTGIMGEAGPEAILPLRRGANGDLGVQAQPSNVNINIVNNSNDTEITQQERTDESGNRTIDLFIENKVRDSIANGGLDRAFKQSFGLERRGL
jgi:tape measure domain-containing protein